MDNNIPARKPSQKLPCEKSIKKETKEVPTSFKKISPKLSPKKAIVATPTPLPKASPPVGTLNPSTNVLHVLGSKPIILQSIQAAPVSNFPFLNNTIMIENPGKVNSNIDKSPKAKNAKSDIEVIQQTSPTQDFQIQSPQNSTLILSPMISNLPNPTLKEATIAQPINVDVSISKGMLYEFKFPKFFFVSH